MAINLSYNWFRKKLTATLMEAPTHPRKCQIGAHDQHPPLPLPIHRQATPDPLDRGADFHHVLLADQPVLGRGHRPHEHPQCHCEAFHGEEVIPAGDSVFGGPKRWSTETNPRVR